ncbi:protein EXORDIUM-like 2 [Rosa sericea]
MALSRSRVHPDQLALALSLLLLITTPSLVSGHVKPPGTICYNGGLLLTGKLDLSIFFYGAIGRTQKLVVRNFIKSLNHGGGTLKPRVTSWWDMVEGYQSVSSPDHNAPKIAVKVVSQITEKGYSLGKVITIDFIRSMVKKATAGKPPASLVVIFTDKESAVASLCRGKCYDHGVIDNQPYLIVGNPEVECPDACGWPFMKSSYNPGSTLTPPNGNPAVDAILVNFAAGLAAAVTNPFNTGFSKPGPKTWPLEASTVCDGIFASGSFPGNPGKVAVDARTGAAFNAHGLKGMKFLLPALWNPRTSSCWTPL